MRRHRRIRCIRQRDSMQCGVAALAMICAYHGHDYDVEWLEQRCTPTPEGVSLKGIADAAHTLGLRTVAARLTPERLREMPLPCILHWRQNHFVVLDGGRVVETGTHDSLTALRGHYWRLINSQLTL